MKRHGNLYPLICDIENLKRAHTNARKGKTNYREVIMVDQDRDFYLDQIRELLLNKEYITSEYRVFKKFDKGKEREIFALPYYPDRIIHWAIVQVLEPIWMSTLITDTYSSLKGRGIHFGLKRLHRDLQDREATKYCLKFDIRKFYPSIDHDILKTILKRKIKDPDVLAILDQVIDSADGVPIGNYLSQFFGNLYLSGFDHWIKEVKRMRFYYRYCDDIVILSEDKQRLHDLFEEISVYLKNTLNLSIKSNYQVFPTFTRGIDFLGYRSFGTYTLLRKSTVRNMKRKFIPLRAMAELTPHDRGSIASYWGWLSWCDGYRLSEKYISPLLAKETV